MSQQFLNQAKELWQTLSAPETVKSYKGTVALTWQIVQRLGKTLWLGLCFILVALDWIGTTGIGAGRSLRAWAVGLQANLQEVKTEEIAAQTGQRVLESGKTGVTNAIANARQQLGLAEKPTMFAVLAEMAQAKEVEAAEAEQQGTREAVAEVAVADGAKAVVTEVVESSSKQS